MGRQYIKSGVIIEGAASGSLVNTISGWAKAYKGICLKVEYFSRPDKPDIIHYSCAFPSHHRLSQFQRSAASAFEDAQAQSPDLKMIFNCPTAAP